MSGVTLIIDRIWIIKESTLVDHGLDRFVDHTARDAVFEESLFDRLLAKAIRETGLISRTDVERDCLIRFLLKLGILSLRCFTVEALIVGIDLRRLDKAESDKFLETCLSSDCGHEVSIRLGILRLDFEWSRGINPTFNFDFFIPSLCLYYNTLLSDLHAPESAGDND